MDKKSIRAQGWVIGLIFIGWMVAMTVALVSSAPVWAKIACLAAVALAVWELDSGLETPNYEPEEWDVERD